VFLHYNSPLGNLHIYSQTYIQCTTGTPGMETEIHHLYTEQQDFKTQ